MVEYLKRKNRSLEDYGLRCPIRTEEKMTEFKKLENMEVVKLENSGDNIEGIYRGFDESRQYPGSYALKIETGGKVRIVFVSNIVIDLLTAHNIEQGREINVLYTGKKKSENSGREYKTYELFAK